MEAKKRERDDKVDEDGKALTKRRKSRFADLVDESAAPPLPVVPVAPVASVAPVVLDAALLKAQLSSQISSLLAASKQTKPAEKKAAYIPLLLDEHGRQIDQEGKLVSMEAPHRTLAANVAQKRRKENPYLQSQQEEDEEGVPVDERIQVSSRSMRGKKSLKFVESGTYIHQEEVMKEKEERKVIAGYASNRKAPEKLAETKEETTPVTAPDILPPPADGGVIPSVEWWDEMFLPKELRELRRSSKATAEVDEYGSNSLSISNCKSFKYIQHPIPLKPLGGEVADAPLPMYLTKKELKRLRKTTRAEREQEKRDKMVAGLIPPPEPKFKLSNFMKVLGDQAVADPSKVEMKVMEQMRKRQLNHEMRNLAAKLTPKERKEKQTKKNMEDTSKQVHVAAFLVKNLSNPRHRFKLDVNAQQHFLSGTVILCSEEEFNLVIAEGGPKGIRKFINLMTNRIDWTSQVEVDGEPGVRAKNEPSTDADDQLPGSPSADMASDTEEGEHDMDSSNREFYSNESRPVLSLQHNKCFLLWNGLMPKRAFVGFKFQECRTQSAIKKLLESKGLSHYFDMAAAIQA